MEIPCVGVIVRDDVGRLLVIQRGRPPGAGLWSIPGGRVEAGETLRTAAVREAREETGLDVVLHDVAGEVVLPGLAAGDTYRVTDFFATVADPSRSPAAGDDASAVRWVTRDELEALSTSPGLVASLADWGSW